MTTPRNALETLLESIESCIRTAELAGFPETVFLLRMVKLDLITKMNNISGEELEALLFVLQSELRIEDHINPPELRQKTAAATPCRTR